MSRRAPLECALCGAAMRNDEHAVWSGGGNGDRSPFCSEECLRLAEAEYTFDRRPTDREPPA